MSTTLIIVLLLGCWTVLAILVASCIGQSIALGDREDGQ